MSKTLNLCKFGLEVTLNRDLAKCPIDRENIAYGHKVMTWLVPTFEFDTPCWHLFSNGYDHGKFWFATAALKHLHELENPDEYEQSQTIQFSLNFPNGYEAIEIEVGAMSHNQSFDDLAFEWFDEICWRGDIPNEPRVEGAPLKWSSLQLIVVNHRV